jgi:aryl-alcohol dehydrogenase-like predicted oxidoreductase
METTLFSTGARIPRIIKGGWQLAGGHGTVDRAAAIRDMFAFAESGVTAFDCADIYTGVESLIGAFLKEWRRVHPSLVGTIRVHTKCVPDLDRLSSLEAREIERIVDRSRRRLGVDAVDLVQLHWWDYGISGFVYAAECLAELRVRGAVRDIGLTNFDTPHLNEILAAGVPVVTHQVQYSLLDRRPANAIATVCAVSGIELLAYGTLAGGFLSESWFRRAEPADSLENRSLTKYKLIIDEFGGWTLFQRLLGLLHDIALTLDATIGAVALRWVLDQPRVASAIAGARNAKHLPATLGSLDLTITPAQRATLDSVLSHAPGPAGDVYDLERVKGGRHAAIMRYNLNTSTD